MLSEPTISKKLNQLPPEAKKQVQDFVDFLYQRHQQTKDSPKSSAGKISENPFFGIWQNREEMTDSVKWVKEVRVSQWANSKS